MIRGAPLVAALLLVLPLLGCGGDAADTGTQRSGDSPSPGQSAPSTAPPTPSPTGQGPSGAPAYAACPATGDEPFTVSLGGREIRGLVRGRGTDVVVLSHQLRSDECDLAALGTALAKAGHRVVSWTAPDLITPRDLELLVARERRGGATSVALVGASWGAAVSLVAATHLTPAPRAVVALSPASTVDAPGDVLAAAQAYRGPLMAVVGEADTAFADLVPLLAQAHPGRESMTVVPGTAEHGHDFVARTTDPWVARIVAFVGR